MRFYVCDFISFFFVEISYLNTAIIKLIFSLNICWLPAFNCFVPKSTLKYTRMYWKIIGLLWNQTNFESEVILLYNIPTEYIYGAHRNYHSRSIFIFTGNLTFFKLTMQFFTVAYEGHWSPSVLIIPSCICWLLNQKRTLTFVISCQSKEIFSFSSETV